MSPHKNWRAATAIACLAFSVMLVRADGLPPPEDENYNPVPSIPGVPAPGVSPKPQKPAPKPNVAAEPPLSPDEDGTPEPEPTPAPAPAPAPTPAPPPTPTPAPTPAPVAEAPKPATPPATAPTTATIVKKPVYEIASVDVALGERQPPFVTVTVKGSVRTGGWKDLELRPLPTLAKEVGMRSYTLVGTPPGGMATQAIAPVTATITIDPVPEDVKTIRVLGETNSVAQTFR